ncbi:MAG: LuxR C-terminal-related transcriptional regulator [Gammaproteobacteria bacterium]|nr:LuxR C-terminal-related transcriptional regulator [Gammaproteobacteria bacterium]
MPDFKTATTYTILILVVVSNTLDFIMDFRSDQVAWHLVQEIIIIVMTLGLLFYLYRNQKRKQRDLAQVVNELKKTEQSLEQSNARIRDARKQYSALIHQQFDDWQLSQSQQEIGLLLLKGLSFNEIAAIRQTKEKTVRQQASEIYKKAGVSGRHAFSAWFFEDFL